jgi:ribosomal-protein-alanine N-acetyltransferase
VGLPEIRTERLFLRSFSEQDVDALHRLWTDPGVRRCLWDDIVISREQAAEVVRSAVLACQEVGYWTLRPAEDGEVIGFCGFRSIENGPDIELMYGLLPQYWGRGLATEASRAALDFLWNNTRHDRGYARTDCANLKSVDVMRRLGMRHHSSTEAMTTYVLERPRLNKPEINTAPR